MVEHGSRQADIYEYDLDAAEMGLTTRLAWTLPSMVTGLGPDQPEVRQVSDGLRALYPSYSPDGQWIAFVGNDGVSNNLGIMRRDGSDIRYLTAYDDGTILFGPRWSPDGARLVCSISRTGQRDIAIVGVWPAAGGGRAPAR